MRTFTRFLIWTALIIALIVGVARAVAFRWFRLPTNDPVLETSVMPSLKGGDLVLAWRVTRPRFGDLVVCPEPDYPDRYVIGRIIGEAGDSLQILDGKPILDGREFVLERGCDPTVFTYPHPDNPSEEVSQQCHWEAIANKLHKTGVVAGHKVPREERQVDVPDGKFFLISDNRLHPYDSRNFGLVEAESCKETIVGRLVSKDGWMDSENRMNFIP